MKIAYLGNSLTAQRNSYVEPLHALLESSWNFTSKATKAGVGGVGSLACAGLLDFLVLRHNVDICFIECSLADTLGATPLDQVTSSVQSILTDLTSNEIIPIILHLPLPQSHQEKSRKVVGIYNHVARDAGVEIIDVRGARSEEDFFDGIHTTIEGAYTLARSISHSIPTTPHVQVRRGGKNKLRGVIRMVPVGHATVKQLQVDRGFVKWKKYRFLLPTLVVLGGSSVQFSGIEGTVLGIYVIADSESGSIKVEMDHSHCEIPVWDPWCEKARIQFLTLPVPPTDPEVVEITARECSQGRGGSTLQLIGLAVSEAI